MADEDGVAGGGDAEEWMRVRGREGRFRRRQAMWGRGLAREAGRGEGGVVKDGDGGDILGEQYGIANGEERDEEGDSFASPDQEATSAYCSSVGSRMFLPIPQFTDYF